MIKEEKRFENSTVLEGITSIRALITAKEAGKNDRPIVRIFYTREHAEKNPKEIAWLAHVGERFGFALLLAEDTEINALSVGNSHGGLLAECGARTLTKVTEKTAFHGRFYAMIQGIEDPYNFGYALRSLYACGADGILLPERNWTSAAGVVARASAGASELLDVYVTAETTEAIKSMKAQGFSVVCADLRTEVSLPDSHLPMPLLLVVGGEKRGISRSILDLADTVVKIPYGRDFDASLSAASATTILAYEIMKQNLK